MKIRTFALAAIALAAAAQSQAAVNLSGYTTYYVSGSSALTPVIKAVLASNCNGAPTTYQNAASGANQFLFTCTLKSTSALSIAINGASATPNLNFALFKRDAGGSAQGVNPVALGTAIAFIDEAGIDAGTKIGTTTKNAVPQLGAADLEPSIFQESLNQTAGVPVLNSTQLGNLVTKTVLLQTFGVAVNNNLYAALQAAQATTGVPTVSTAFMQSLVNKGGLSGATTTWGTILGSTDGSQVNVCRRAAGSGTQAGANLLFTPPSELPLVAADSDATAPDNSGFVYVNEGSATGNVKTCLNAADTAGAGNYAVGYIGYENKPVAGTDTWKFVKLDGYTADIANAQNGLYYYAFENTFNYNKTLSGVPLAIATTLITEAGQTATVAAFSTDLKSAVVPVSASNATRGGNSRNALKVVK